MWGIIIITVVALVLSIILTTLYAKFNKNDKSSVYLSYLPGYNCGVCGFGSCEGMSEAMCRDTDNYKKCKPLRGDALERMEEFLKNDKAV